MSYLLFKKKKKKDDQNVLLTHKIAHWVRIHLSCMYTNIYSTQFCVRNTQKFCPEKF